MNNEKKYDIADLLLQTQSMSELLNNIGAYVFSKDLEGKYTYVNSDVAELFQTTVSNVIGKDDSHFFDLEVSDELRQNDLNVIRNKICIESEENNVIKSTGKLHTYKTIKKPLLNSQGDVIGLTGISTDITVQKTLEAENRDQKHLLDVILNNVDAYIYMKDSNRYFKYVNSKVAELFGLPAKDIIGKRDIDVIPQEFADHFWQTDKLVFENNEKHIINEALLGADNKMHHYLSIKVPCDIKDNSNTLIGFSTDVTELYQLKEKFKQLANTDELTGLYNRRYFFENAKREFNRAKRHQQALAVISIDVDHFKAINDQYGHTVGDKVLQQFSSILSEVLRAGDIAARWGGEEFIVLLPKANKEETLSLAKRLSEAVEQFTFELNIKLTISVGISQYNAHDNVESWIERADIALYKAKNDGRNCIKEMA